MTPFENDLASALRGYTALTDLLTNGPDDILPVRNVRTPVTPSVIWQVVNYEPQVSLAGFTGQLEKVRLQVDVYATTFDSCIAIAAQVKAALNASTNPRGFCMNESDGFEDNVTQFRRVVEFSLYHRTG